VGQKSVPQGGVSQKVIDYVTCYILKYAYVSVGYLLTACGSSAHDCG